MAKLFGCCRCGNKFEINIIGEGLFSCQKCKKAYYRVYDSIQDMYIIKEFSTEKKKTK